MHKQLMPKIQTQKLGYFISLYAYIKNAKNAEIAMHKDQQAQVLYNNSANTYSQQSLSKLVAADRKKRQHIICLINYLNAAQTLDQKVIKRIINTKIPISIRDIYIKMLKVAKLLIKLLSLMLANSMQEQLNKQIETKRLIIKARKAKHATQSNKARASLNLIAITAKQVN